MIRFLFPFILLVLSIILARRYINTAPIEEQKSRKITVLLIALTIFFLILTLLHRMHWLGAIVPALILAGRKIAESLSSIFNGKKSSAEKNTTDSTTNDSSQHQQSSTQNTSGNMNEEEALKVLGLQQPYSKDAVIEAHRKLMQKLHPDRGGNDYLAAKINDAKELLLKKY